jgi:hypothetical protein
MGKGRFLNQKLGKRTSRRVGLLKSAFHTSQAGPSVKASLRQEALSRGGRDGKAHDRS